MIMHKGKQVGFIQHENNNIDKVMHNGNCVFEQGYPRDNNTITGDIVLDGTIGKSLKSWSITGNTVQNGTPSPDNPVEIQSVGERTKNLFDAKTIFSGINESDGVYTSGPNSFHVKRRYFGESELNKTYTFSAYLNVISLNSSNEMNPRTSAMIDGTQINGTIVKSTSGRTLSIVTFTPISASDYVIITYGYGGVLSVDSPQLEVGSTATPYEPYGYKIPVVNRGKNLFDYKTMSNGQSGVYLTEDGRLLEYEQWSITDYIPCSGNVFTINSIGGISAGMCLYDSQKNFITGIAYGTRGAEYKKSVTIKSETNASYIRFSYFTSSDPRYADRIDDLSKIQLEAGSVATTYEPYREPITTPIYYLSEPLRKLGDYTDTIEYVGNGQAKIIRNIKSLTLTGTENWKFQSVNDYGIYNFYINTESGRGGGLAICNNFITQTTLIADTQTIGILLSISDNRNTQLYLRVDNTIATDVDTLKSWLAAKYNSGSPVIVEYVLNTPTEEIIEVPQIPTFRNTPTIKGIMTSLSVDTTIKPSATNVSFRSTNKYQRFISRYIDFDNNKMSTISGDFSNIRAFTNRRRCNVLDDGTISAFYGDDNYVEDGSNGQVMVYQPKFYYKVEPIRLEPITGSIGYHIREAIYSVSDIPLTGYKLHPAFINEAGNEVDYFCLSAFEGCAYDVSNSAYITNDSQTVDFTANTGDKLSSIANVKPMSGLTQQLTRPNSEIIAKNRGAGWHTYGIKQASANQMLMFIEYGNLQSNIGSGVVSITDNTSYNCSSYTGSTSSLGNTTGRATSTINEIGGTETTYTDNGKTSISYRGMENPYGNIWDFVYGVNIHGDGTQRGGIPYICTDYNYAESKNSDNYVSAGFTTVNSSGYIKAFGYGNPDYDWLFMGSDTGGASNGIIGDYHYITANLNGYRIAFLGGTWYNGSSAGGFDWALNSGVGNRFRNIGARLCYVPQS